MRPADHTRFAPAETISWNDVGEELTVFDCTTNGYFILNGSAVAIWRELAAGRSVGETVDALTMRFDSPRKAIADDVAAFVRTALDRNLLVARR